MGSIKRHMDKIDRLLMDKDDFLSSYYDYNESRDGSPVSTTTATDDNFDKTSQLSGTFTCIHD